MAAATVTKFTGAVTKRLPDIDAESIRRNHEQRLAEVQTAVQAIQTTPGRFLARQQLTSSGTYTPTSGTKAVRVRLVGGGGGGGGASAVGLTVSQAGGGASGMCLEFVITSAQALTGGALTIGAAGAGGSTAGGNGGAGGDSSVTINGTVYTAKGGGGGGGSTASGALSVSSGGSTTTGSSTIGTATGWPGGDGVIFSTSAGGIGYSGAGGSSLLGPGAPRVVGLNTPAAAPPGFGGGGAGSVAVNSGIVGGAGAPGAMVVEEFG